MAIAKRVKVKAGENLTDANIERVMKLLEQPKPISKKEACAALNISYNTTRLGSIIEGLKSRKEADRKRRAANRGKPATEAEIKAAITDYLNGETVSDIAKASYRSSAFIRNIVEGIGVPQRGTGQNYFNFDLLPEECVADSFDIGETAWSARYQSPCLIDKLIGKTKDGESNLYRVYVLSHCDEPAEVYFSSWGTPGFYATQPAYELGKLTHLEAFGVDIRKIKTT